MADIKRPNYFTSQFLVDRDFNDEQAYHLIARRRHNRVLHTSGVVEGLDVTRISATQVQVAPGTAIDSSGREIVVSDAQTYTLATAGNDLDVFLTVAYQEVFDPADHYTQAGLDKFTRTTEHPQLQDGTAVPPADGSVIVLAKIHLNATGAIESNASIDPTARTLGGPRIPPKSVGTTQLADGAVTLGKLASDAQPTASQVDNRGGVNQLVTQINAGSGVITRSHLESAVASGTVTFQNLSIGSEMFSNDIDPGFGAGPLSLQLAVDDLPAASITSTGDTNYARPILLRGEINRATGRFKVFVTRTSGTFGTPVANVTVRWYAIKPLAALDATVGVGVVVNPPNASLVNNNTQLFNAVVSNATNATVTWSIQEANGGALFSSAPTSTTYAPPGISGTYHLVATSAADPTRKTIVPIVVNADITVTVNPGNPTIFRGESTILAATVVNTPVTGVTWSIQQGAAGGTLSATTGPNVTYTAPTVPGTYNVIATSAADGNKKGVATITVPALTFSIVPDTSTVPAGSATTIRASVGGSSNGNANWASLSSVASVSPAFGTTTIFHAPSLGGSFIVNASAAADPSKTASVTITVPNIKSPAGEGGGGGGGKFVPISENLSPFSAVSSVAPQSSPAPETTAPETTAPEAAMLEAKPADAADTEAAARSFVAPKKRGATKLPPKPSDG